MGGTVATEVAGGGGGGAVVGAGAVVWGVTGRVAACVAVVAAGVGAADELELDEYPYEPLY